MVFFYKNTLIMASRISALQMGHFALALVTTFAVQWKAESMAALREHSSDLVQTNWARAFDCRALGVLEDGAVFVVDGTQQRLVVEVLGLLGDLAPFGGCGRRRIAALSLAVLRLRFAGHGGALEAGAFVVTAARGAEVAFNDVFVADDSAPVAVKCVAIPSDAAVVAVENVLVARDGDVVAVITAIAAGSDCVVVVVVATRR